MAGFKYIPQNFLLKKLVEFWKNVVKNYGGTCLDDDFFDVVCNELEHEKVVDLIEMAYSAKEIHTMEVARQRYGRLDLTDSSDDILQSLWNNDRGRRKCRIVLETLGDYIVHGLPDGDADILEMRFKELKSMFRLADLELEILMLAYVRCQTCFSWPCRVDDHEKPLYYAMALDRSFSEVTDAMSDRGRLFKYNLLDGDFDFNRRTLGAFMDGTAGDAVVRRFYRRCDVSDALPWDYYG